MRRRLFAQRRNPWLRSHKGLVGVVAVVGVVLALALRSTEPGEQAITEPVDAGAIDQARVAALEFLDTYMRDDGRVERTDQGGDTVSEGQAYAMMLAAGIGDPVRFQVAWGWAKDNLQREDGLLAWRWDNGAIVDDEPATDADLDAARALLVAAERFDEPAYKDEAVRIADAILAHETVEIGGRSVLLAGPWAQSNQPYVINPSYFAPRTFTMLERATGDDRWDQLAKTSREIVSKFAERAVLVPDWAVITTSNEVYATSPPSDPEREVGHSFDGQRTYVRFAEDCDPGGRALGERAWEFARHERRDRIDSVYGLQGEPRGGGEAPSAVVSFAGLAKGQGHDVVVSDLLDRAREVAQRAPTYYGAAWVALGRMMLTTSLLGDCL